MKEFGRAGGSSKRPASSEKTIPFVHAGCAGIPGNILVKSRDKKKWRYFYEFCLCNDRVGMD